MKPEFMRLRRALAATVTALLLAAGIVALSPALSASAHNSNVRADCDTGLTVDLASYPSYTTLNVVIDNATIDTTTFSNGIRNWTKTYTWDSKVNHSFTVAVVSPDDPINPSTLQGANHWTFTESGSVTGCQPPDVPVISVTGQTCANPSVSDGTISFTLSGVTKPYTVSLDKTSKTVTSSGGTGIFSNVAPGTYTITASTPGGPSVTSSPVTLSVCTPSTPVIALAVEPCLTGGAVGAVTANLSSLAIGSTYTVRLFSADDSFLGDQSLTALAATAQLSFAGHGPGTFYATIADQADNVLATSSNTTVSTCASGPTITVELEPCVPVLPFAGAGNQGLASMALRAPMAPTVAEREITVQVDGLLPTTVYTVQLVTTDPSALDPVIATTTTPGDSATTFTYTFTGVPTPGEYTVRLLGGNAPLVSDPITAPLCFSVPTLAPPSIEASVQQCDGVDPAVGALSASLIDLDTTKTYYVRIVDNGGNTVAGGGDQLVTGVATAIVHFPGITAPGTYTAQLLIDPGKQLAATDPNAVTLEVCLPTLAMTGPGVLIPLGSIAALLLTLGGAVVMGRLRRRMAL